MPIPQVKANATSGPRYAAFPLHSILFTGAIGGQCLGKITGSTQQRSQP